MLNCSKCDATEGIYVGNVTQPATLTAAMKGVTALAFNRAGNLLASAGKDTDIVVWDVIAEAGQCRLQGHKDAVTDVHFLEDADRPLLISTSKDTLAKLWELETQHCVQTLVGHRSEIWSLAVTGDGARVVTVSSKHRTRAHFAIPADFFS